MEKQIKGIICLCGNDGTGKSTLFDLFTKNHPEYLVLQRSAKQFDPELKSLHAEIKHIDQLTFKYAFEEERRTFDPSYRLDINENKDVEIHWILLNLEPSVIQKRISGREEFSIYQSKKCVEYFSFIYLQMAAFYGMTIVDVDCEPAQMCLKILRMIESGATKEIRNLQLKKVSISRIQQLDIANQVIQQLEEKDVQNVIKEKVEKQIQEDLVAYQFYYPQLKELLEDNGQNTSKLKKNLAGRCITAHNQVQIDQNHQMFIKCGSKQTDKKVFIQSPCFRHVVEGESKIIFQVISKLKEVTDYFSDKVWIILKSTIYSHTKQCTGEIQNLGEIRAIGSNLFLEMLRRNNLHHAYIAINSQGVILSRKIEVNMLEVVFKREFVGTDKHSYYGLGQEPLLAKEEGKLKNGIYIRFDWRNPNHIIKNHSEYLLNQNIYYYVIEKSIGKQIFFDKFLRKDNVKPVGDKCITEDLIKNYVNTKAIKKAALSLYCAFSYYCRNVDLQIIDGCFMFDKQGSVVWSEINPDCMRVKKIETGNQRMDYDKDIWRVGGSSSKDKIKEKWTLFNKLLIDYFQKNRYFQTQLLNRVPLEYTKGAEAQIFLKDPSITLSEEYRQYFTQISQCTQKKRQLIATIDISEGKPTLVKSSELTEHHSEGSLDKAYDHISVLPKVVCVDLDAALGRQGNNRQQIKKLKRKGLSNIYGVGGGIRSLEVLNYYLNDLTIPRAIISSHLQLLDHISKDVIAKRIIVQLSINEKNEILTHGRTVNTGQNIIKKMIQLCKKGVKVVSLTFNHKEGHLSGIPREQFRDIMYAIPGPINQVIIAGGISSLNDLQFIWSFPKAVPQLGSAIWKQKVAISDLLCRLVEFKNKDLCPAIISTESGKLLGEFFMDRQAIKMTVETRYLYRFSRKLKRLIKKGQYSGNTQKVLQMKLDCDNDCFNIVVEDNDKNFCHLDSKSCFEGQSINSFQTLGALQQHIFSKKTGSGYSRQMQENYNFSALKIQEESFQLITSKDRVTEEGADLLAHILMFLNSKNIPLKSIMTELNGRANKLRDLEELVLGGNKKVEKFACMGLMESKYIRKLDQSAENLLGISIKRFKGRSLRGQIVIQDQQKYKKYFDDCQLQTIIMKAKDMVQMLYKKEIKWCFNYSIVMQNCPYVWKEVVKELIPSIKLCLIKKKKKKVDPLSWSSKSKGKIASEYPLSTINYLHNLGVHQTSYSIYKINGSSEAYLQCDTFDYCDAIVETGATLEENQLEIVTVLCKEIYGALYTLL